MHLLIRPLLRQGTSELQISNAVYNFVKVPTKPPSNVEEVRNQYDQTLVQQLEEVKSRMLV